MNNVCYLSATREVPNMHKGKKNVPVRRSIKQLDLETLG